jgi:hypothetical protein
LLINYQASNLSTTGKVVVSPQFKHAGDFHEGRASVKVGEKLGFVDETGKVVIPPQFDRVEDFAGGLGRVAIGGNAWTPTKRHLSRFTAVGIFRRPAAQLEEMGFIDASGNGSPLSIMEVGPSCRWSGQSGGERRVYRPDRRFVIEPQFHNDRSTRLKFPVWILGEWGLQTDRQDGYQGQG